MAILKVRQLAVRMGLDGGNLGRLARHLGVNHQSVANWVKAHADWLPPAPRPEQVDIVEMNDLFTFIQKKNKACIAAFVDRATRCVVNWFVCWEPNEDLVDQILTDTRVVAGITRTRT